MKRTTRWMIIAVFYISQLFGIVAFSYDMKTGKIQKKFFITVYCAIISLLMFGTVPLMIHVDWKPKNAEGPELHFKLNTLMCLITIVAVLITVVFNWIKLNAFIKTLEDFQHFRWQLLQKYQIPTKAEKYFENSVRSKFYWGFVSNITMFIATYDFLGDIFNVKSSIVTSGLGLLVPILNTIMTHYYFAIMHVNVLQSVINEEVEKVLNASLELFKLQRLKQIDPGSFITKCCQLADDLDYLAMSRYNLQQLINRINSMYDVQGACVLLCTYLNNISVTYIAIMVVKDQVMYQEYGKWIGLAVLCGLFLYYVDLELYMEAMLNVRDYCEYTGHLLKNRQTFLPTLDVRLEKSLNNFSLQLASFPLEMKLVGLFPFGRPLMFAVFGSTISNAIVLIQYDYKNNKCCGEEKRN